MSHVREQLVQAVITAVTGLATTGARVHRRRPAEYPLTELPALRIYLEGDSASSSGIGVPFYERPTAIRIDAVVKQTGDVEAALNQIGAEVETALGPALTIGAGHPFLFYRGGNFDDSAEGDKPVAVLSMRFEAVLETVHGVPETSNEH